MKNAPQKTRGSTQENESHEVYKQLFVEFVENSIKENGIEEENFSSNLQDLYFKNSTFPKGNNLVALKDQEVRNTIFRPLFYRHLKDSVNEGALWDHYIKLFDLILNGNEESLKDLDLPNEWVWDFIDEFIYQYQAIEFNKSRLFLKGETDIKKIDDKKWNIITIFTYLEKFVRKSEIVEVLSRPHKDSETILNATGYKHLLQLFGYMSLQGLFRLNCMIGDYLYAIKLAEPIISLGRLKNRSILSEITPICHIDTYYYISFAYMMIRRYNDCITSLQYILSYIEKNTKYIQSRSYRYQQLFKKTEQLYSILIIVFSLSPQPIEFTLYTKVNEKGSEFMEQIREGELAGFDQLFHNCAPKFLSLSPLNPEVKEDRHLQTYNLQKELFISDVQQQLSLPKISSYLKLYSSIEITKLAGLCGLSNQNLTKFLLSTKNKTRKVVDSVKMRGDSLGHFFIIKDMIHVDTNKRQDKFKKIFVDEFIGQSGKLQRIINLIK